MHIQDILTPDRPSFSFEFFPPRSPDGREKLLDTARQLSGLSPSFASVTYGAGGTTRELTHDLVIQLRKDAGLEVIPHLTCVGHTAGDIEAILARYAEAGVSNLLALRGDPPHGAPLHPGDFANASELVAAARAFRHPEERRGFGIGVAGFPEGHPGTPNRLVEMDFLKAKVDAGADYICTQLFFDNRDFHDFCARCELAGIRVPILAGIMPVTTLSGLTRMAELAGGARFPARLLKALQRANGDAEAVRRIGIHYATEQCADLLDHRVAGIHFYTLNQATAVQEIYRNLGLAEAVF